MSNTAKRVSKMLSGAAPLSPWKPGVGEVPAEVHEPGFLGGQCRSVGFPVELAFPRTVLTGTARLGRDPKSLVSPSGYRQYGKQTEEAHIEYSARKREDVV